MTASRLGLAEGWGRLKQMRFNGDQSCMICALDDGVRIYNLEPLREKLHLDTHQLGSISKVEMLQRTNLVAVVGGGSRPMYADNVVMVYDDRLNKCVLEFTMPTPVLAIRIKRDVLIAVCRTQIHVFSFPNRSKKLYTITTRENPRGLCEVTPMRTSHGDDGCGGDFMVFPGYKTGSLQIVNMATTEQRVSSAPVTINAHQNELCCLAINQQGSMIASASVKGTLIRIWDSTRRVMLVELRRGSDQATLYCLNFSLGDEWLCCSSDKGTVHVFALQDYRLNKRSALATIGVPGAYAGSQWSLANFTVPQEVACICAFGSSNQSSAGETHRNQSQGTIYAVCLDGSFHKYHFSADGVCNQVSYDVFTELCEDCEWVDMLKQ